MSSLLQEIDYSTFNLRDSFVTDISSYQADLRDEVLFSNWGIKVLIRIPKNENEVDEYSNFVDCGWIETTESVVPLFKDYRDNVSVEGMTAEQSELYPLQILLPSKLHLPKFSHIIFTEYNSREEKIAREWQVLSTQMKQLSNGKTYSRIAFCVPARKETWNIASMDELITPATIWFWYGISKEGINVDTSIRAQGTIWFSYDQKAVAHIITDDVQETPDILPEVEEVTELLFTYDDRAKNIMNPGNGFRAGYEYALFDGDGNPVEVIIEENGLSVPLTVQVLAIDEETGAIKEFTYNYRKAYTDYSRDNYREVYLSSGEVGSLATIKLIALNNHVIDDVREDVLHGTINNPIFIQSVKLNALFEAKGTAISVLN